MKAILKPLLIVLLFSGCGKNKDKPHDYAAEISGKELSGMMDCGASFATSLSPYSSQPAASLLFIISKEVFPALTPWMRGRIPFTRGSTIAPSGSK